MIKSEVALQTIATRPPLYRPAPESRDRMLGPTHAVTRSIKATKEVTLIVGKTGSPTVE